MHIFAYSNMYIRGKMGKKHYFHCAMHLNKYFCKFVVPRVQNLFLIEPFVELISDKLLRLNESISVELIPIFVFL